MRLSTRSRYGLRAMVFMARNAARVVSSEMIAESEDISKKYLDRILNKLRKSGLLRSVKGQGGGYVLSRPADEIRTDQIVAALEGSLCLVACVDHPYARKHRIAARAECGLLLPRRSVRACGVFRFVNLRSGRE